MTLSILQSNSSVATMTSLELVDFINSQDPSQNLSHANFLAKVPKVLGSAAHSFECTGTYTNGTGAVLPRKIYNFPKREACLMAMSYSYDLQAKVFDKMTALETQQAAAPAIPTTLSAALRLAADQADQIEQQQAQLAIAAPKAQALDRIAGAEGSMCITDAAKAIKLQPKRLFAWMHANGWIYKRAGSSKWVAHQSRLKSAHLDCEYITVLRADGTEKNIPNVLVTAKGLAKLAEAVAQ